MGFRRGELDVVGKASCLRGINACRVQGYMFAVLGFRV